MYAIFLIPFLTNNRYYLRIWMSLIIFMNLTWYFNKEQCILIQLETNLGQKHKRDTLTCRYALLTQQEKKQWSRVLLVVVALLQLLKIEK